MKVASLQMNTQDDKAANIRQAIRLIDEAVAAEAPDLVVLPETFTYMGGSVASQRAHAETFPEGEAYQAMQAQAKKHGIFLHAGSMSEAAGEKCYNTSLVFDRGGREVARYRKIHLFDVEVPGGPCYRESDTMKGGGEVVTYDLKGVTVGCTICYDLRFPGLYRVLAQAGAEILCVPAAFTKKTGEAHWHVLNRARAIENGAFVVAPCAIGPVAGGGEAYGHSLIVDPWGEVLADGGTEPGFITATIDLGRVAETRRRIPSLRHDRAFDAPRRAEQEVA